MKSVGEAMAIGRTFHESVQKALASLETGLTALRHCHSRRARQVGHHRGPCRVPRPIGCGSSRRPCVTALSDAEIGGVTKFDPWSCRGSAKLLKRGAGSQRGAFRSGRGFAPPEDARFHRCPLAKLTGRDEGQVRRARERLALQPCSSGSIPAPPNSRRRRPTMYSTYEVPAMGEVECEARPSARKKVVILGGGPNRIGQGIEFDYCCCHAPVSR